ncbi:4-phosphoerythronate dehydrogenase [uncultured Eubacteriales bacterium]|uniref:4-phosphoerythronate dehydrogenase n=1 Tax=uncultured Eubacteriales bacterium TaxID=172733 RepID=A0A212J1T9_9FIRM|nr:4-phosphoerythronate dehydrogenase [uncultured Eubacteriales bacterium]
MDKILNLLSLTEDERASFEAAAPGYEHIFCPADSLRSAADIEDPSLYESASIIFGCPPPKVLIGAKKLRWLQTWSAGVDSYLRSGVFPDGAALTSAVGAYGQAVSEHMFAMLLSLLKFLPQYRDLQHGEGFDDLGAVKSVRGSTILVLGTGDIGSSFAALCKSLGAAKVLGLRRDPSKNADGVDEMHPFTDLEALLPQADVVAMVLPRSPETDGLMNEARLRLMKPDAVLLNAGRGTAVDCDALARILASGHLWGAGLDVTAPEPLPAGHPLWQCPNALLTPHIAGGEHLPATRALITAIALENLRAYVAGQPLRNRMK